MLLIAHPWLALVPAIAFAVVAARGGRRRAWLTACAWALYAAYEWAMHERVLCTGECNIRVDLLLLYPLLLALSAAAVWAAVRGPRRSPPAPHPRQ